MKVGLCEVRAGERNWIGTSRRGRPKRGVKATHCLTCPEAGPWAVACFRLDPDLSLYLSRGTPWHPSWVPLHSKLHKPRGTTQGSKHLKALVRCHESGTWTKCWGWSGVGVKDECSYKGKRTLFWGKQRKCEDAKGLRQPSNLKLQQLNFPGFLF